MTKTSSDYRQKYTQPGLRERLKEEIKHGSKGGRPGEWSARKSQLLVQEYEKAGGGYRDSGTRTSPQKSLEKWTQEDWQTIEGEGRARGADGEVKRYLPKKAWDQLSPREKKQTDAKKRAASRDGRQYVDNTRAAREARRKLRSAGSPEQLREKTKKELAGLASDFKIEGRSRMRKDELVTALAQAARS